MITMHHMINPFNIFYYLILFLSFAQHDSIEAANIRSPCRMYVWDIPSAIRFHMCKRLLQENMFEGLGGAKVRILNEK